MIITTMLFNPVEFLNVLLIKKLKHLLEETNNDVILNIHNYLPLIIICLNAYYNIIFQRVN